MIEFEGVSKVYQHNGEDLRAVDRVDLNIEKGEIFGVIGFSGAGKSTLVRLVNLLEKPTQGRVLVGGEDLSQLTNPDLRKVRKRIGMIFQHFNLLDSKTVLHNVAFPLSISGVPKSEINKRVEEILEFVGIAEKANQYPDELSGGQKQRVGIARALATSPDILLCDEATSALDPETTKSILNLLKKVRDEYKITILMITHEMNVVREICDRIAVMENGRVIEKGSIFELFSNPQHVTTQNFVRTVMENEIPPSILEGISKRGGNRHIYRITFIEESAGQPVLSQVSKNYEVEVNVLFGQITELQGIPFGHLVVELQGDDKEIIKAIDYIQHIVAIQEVVAHAG
ncbi:methionine ABC transporter ATP-binding protein [Halobacillus shinanisalinarum]|uniref:Methionine ABC transporter ATP-binding protein n=1 Tax=Halobacillus shinanisalinarum TaxID=2932258 RepID=A0ABY4H587_9BACI|nr:methionine ABC transporter ATP-binding protein [Halobacillus shinanisalinarum]UOQ95376.1 methionine ABC transporter ATP-binding protein [Halobacillus shinanisalinarum]